MSDKKDMRMVKCPYCEDRLPRGEAIQHTNKRYYHKKCYEEATKSSRHYKELIECICDIWGIDKPTMQMVMQIKRYKDEYNLTDKGMELTLRYFYELNDNNPREGDGIGIIPWKYDEARDYHASILKLKKDMQDYEFDKTIKNITIPQPRRQDKNRIERIDIESL